MTNKLKYFKDYYSVKDIAQKYMERRLGYPIGQYRQEMQVRAIRETIKHYNIKKLLEIAPGPGRLTAEVQVERGLAIDSSEEMLKLARNYVHSENWEFRLGNALELETGEKFGMVMSFRFVQHLEQEQRQKLYTTVNNNLSSKGLWVFDVTFHKTFYLGWLTDKRDPKMVCYEHRNRNELEDELTRAGFQVVQYYSYLNHTNLQHIIGRLGKNLTRPTIQLIKFLDYLPPRLPHEEVVVCQRK